MAVDLPPPAPLVQIEQLAPASSRAPTQAQNLRARSQREAALSLGAQAGLAWRGAQIRTALEGQALQLDQVYDFKRLLHDGHVLPPVITEARNGFRVDGQDAARSQRVSWTLAAPARLVSLAPTWRDYLLREDPPVDLNQVPDLLRPANGEERAAWQAAVREGWQQGVAQMDAIHQVQVAKLTRDFTGMVRFELLVAQGIVSAPRYAQGRIGVTQDGKTLYVDDRVLRITAPAAFQTQVEQWQPWTR